jgi:hypothetical protein
MGCVIYNNYGIFYCKCTYAGQHSYIHYSCWGLCGSDSWRENEQQATF